MIKNQWALGALTAGILTIIIQLLVGTGGVILMIIAMVCGIVGLIKYKKNPEIGGKWLSIAGMLIIVIYILILFLPIINIVVQDNITGTTSLEDKTNAVGVWRDADDILYWIVKEDGTLFQGLELESISGDKMYYKLEKGKYLIDFDQDFDGAVDYNYEYENKNKLVLTEPWCKEEWCVETLNRVEFPSNERRTIVWGYEIESETDDTIVIEHILGDPVTKYRLEVNNPVLDRINETYDVNDDPWIEGENISYIIPEDGTYYNTNIKLYSISEDGIEELIFDDDY